MKHKEIIAWFESELKWYRNTGGEVRAVECFEAAIAALRFKEAHASKRLAAESEAEDDETTG